MPGTRLTRLAAEAAAAHDPATALRLVGELRRELDVFERRQVAHALAEGASFAAIARELGVSRQAAHRRFRGVAADEAPLVLARDASRVLRYAREEAGAMGASAVGSEHVLLAVLRASGCRAAAALRAAGVALDRARTLVDGGPADAHALLAGPARAARARRGRRIEVEDLLEAALENPEGGAARTVRALGADPVALRGELRR